MPEGFPRDPRPAYRAVARALRPEQRPLLRHLRLLLDEHYSARTLRDEAATWESILGHLPAIAPTLQRLRDHIEQGAAFCPTCYHAPPSWFTTVAPDAASIRALAALLDALPEPSRGALLDLVGPIWGNLVDSHRAA